MSRTVLPPCKKDCPRRRVQPNCHNRDYCPEWGKFEDAEAAWKAERMRIIKETKDAEAFTKSSCRRCNRLTKKS